MRILLSVLLLAISYIAFSQRNDTTWWQKPWQIQSITQYNGNNVRVDCWHRNGRPMASGRFILKSGWVPVSDILVLDSTGSKVQEYIYYRGELINYLPGGMVKDVLSAPLYDTAQRYTEYYTNSRFKTRSFASKDTGRNGIYFFLPNYNKEIAFMYQQETRGYYRYEEFYPNGRIYKRTNYAKQGEQMVYRHIWYSLSGAIDPSSYVELKTNSYAYIKQGRRLEWWNNTKLKTEEYYKNDQLDSVRHSWHENGLLQLESFYKNGTPDSISRSWYPDGQLKYYSDFRVQGINRPSLNFHPNGMIERQEGAILSGYDSDGRLLFEFWSAGNYNGSYDFRSRNPSGNLVNEIDRSKPNPNRYLGSFDKMREGKWLAYDAAGQLMYSTFYKNGLTEGETLIYDTLGYLRARKYYREGRLHGPYLVMNNMKDTMEYGHYVNGRKLGIWRTFHYNGQLQAIAEFGKGEYGYEEIAKYDEKGNVSLSTHYDSLENKRVQHFYFAGSDKIMYTLVKHGDRKEMDTYGYHANGNLRNKIIYQPDGTTFEEYWFDNGQQEMVTRRRDGKAFGKMTMWFSNGKKRYEGLMKAGIRDGEWVYYNEDGSIASMPYFENGVEVVKQPENTACFCNKTYPAFGPNAFFNSAEAYMPLSSINRIMQRFQLDTTYKHAFVRCHYCWPMPILVFKDVNLLIGKEGMSLNFTPCRQGHNYGMVEIGHFKYTHITNEYHDYDENSSLLIPPDLPELLARTIAILEHRSDIPLYQFALSEISGDTLFFHHFMNNTYAMKLPLRSLTEEEESTAMQEAEEHYAERRDDESPSFEKDLGYKLANAILPFFPQERTMLIKKRTDRKAINKINAALHPYISPEELEHVERLAYGALYAQLDSGSLSLNLPPNIISVFDPLTGKRVLKNGKPSPVSFLLSYKELVYESYPSDRLRISGVFNTCAPAFTIGKTGAWIKPGDFEFSFEPVIENYHAAGSFNPYNYPAHYSKLEMVFEDGYRRVKAHLDEYIRNFMGVMVKHGEMNLSGLSTSVPVTNVIIDAKELNGLVKIPMQSSVFTEEQLITAFKKAGFKVYPEHPEWNKEEGVVTIYFNYTKK